MQQHTNKKLLGTLIPQPQGCGPLGQVYINLPRLSGLRIQKSAKERPRVGIPRNRHRAVPDTDMITELPHAATEKHRVEDIKPLCEQVRDFVNIVVAVCDWGVEG